MFSTNEIRCRLPGSRLKSCCRHGHGRHFVADIRRGQARPETTQAKAGGSGPEDAQQYDVYVAGPQPLKEGFEKHIISVFVADESGIINRVAGVFARRGMNIESLAVGLNVDKALFTITVNGTPSGLANMVKQLAKLVKVRFVEDITYEARLDRELALFKIAAPHGPRRSEVMELLHIFQGKVSDVGPDSFTVALTGDPGKLFAFEAAVRPFGLTQLARTGRITLRTSDHSGGFAGMPPYESERTREQALQRPALGSGVGESSMDHREGADVYVFDTSPQSGPWSVQNILDPAYESAASLPDFKAHTLLIEVDDVPGVLNEVTGVIARRGYNIQSLAVGNSEVPGRSRITTVVPGQGGPVDKLIKQIEKLIVVISVQDLTDVPHVSRELMLVKVRCAASLRGELKSLAEIFKARVCHVTHSSVTIEVIGTEARMRHFQDLLRPYGILEVARTGRIALERASKVDSRLLATSQLGRYA